MVYRAVCVKGVAILVKGVAILWQKKNRVSPFSQNTMSFSLHSHCVVEPEPEFSELNSTTPPLGAYDTIPAIFVAEYPGVGSHFALTITTTESVSAGCTRISRRTG